MFPSATNRLSDFETPEEEGEHEEEPEEVIDEVALAINEDIIRCFEIFDRADTGEFEEKYLEKALKSLGIPATATELADLEQIIKDGMIQFEPFRAYAFEKISELDEYEALKEAFAIFDPDDEGFVPTDRFRKWMLTLGNPLNEKEVKELISLGDPAKTGIIPYDDLAASLLAN